MLFRRKKRKTVHSDHKQSNTLVTGTSPSATALHGHSVIDADPTSETTKMHQANCVIVGSTTTYADVLNILTQRGFHIHYLDLSITPEHIDDMLPELSSKDKQALFMETNRTDMACLKKAGLHTWIVLSALIDTVKLSNQHIQFYIDPVISDYVPQWNYILPMAKKANIDIWTPHLLNKVKEASTNCNLDLSLEHQNDFVSAWMQFTFSDSSS